MSLELIRKKTHDLRSGSEAGFLSACELEKSGLLEPEIYARLSRVFREIFDDEITIGPRTTAQDVEGWDSFAHINLVLAAESEFGVRFTSSDVERMLSVGDLVSCILRRRPEQE